MLRHEVLEDQGSPRKPRCGNQWCMDQLDLIDLVIPLCYGIGMNKANDYLDEAVEIPVRRTEPEQEFDTWERWVWHYIAKPF